MRKLSVGVAALVVVFTASGISLQRTAAQNAPAISQCSYCHQASIKKDEVWTQFYPRLDHEDTGEG